MVEEALIEADPDEEGCFPSAVPGDPGRWRAAAAEEYEGRSKLVLWVDEEDVSSAGRGGGGGSAEAAAFSLSLRLERERKEWDLELVDGGDSEYPGG